MSTKDKIMDAAEGYIRTCGFNSFSFRDIAAEIGIKSASVHYHFATKDDLGEAVTRRYSDRIADLLGDPSAENVTTDNQVTNFIEIYRSALQDHQKMCLCGMMGAEINSLGNSVRAAVADFFSMQEDWLSTVLGHSCGLDERAARKRARASIAALQGAILMARAANNNNIFEDIASQLANDMLAEKQA